VVDATTEEGHSAPRTKVPRTDIARMQASLMRGGEDFQAEGLGDLLRLDCNTFTVVKIGGEW
jgi:hypothetical protein